MAGKWEQIFYRRWNEVEDKKVTGKGKRGKGLDINNRGKEREETLPKEIKN